MTLNRRGFIRQVGVGAGAAYLSPLLNWAHAQGRSPRRFVFVVEGNGIEPGAFLSANARAASVR